MEEWQSADPADIIEISPPNWNPQEHHEETLANSPTVVNVNNMASSMNSEMDEDHYFILDQMAEAVTGTILRNSMIH